MRDVAAQLADDFQDEVRHVGELLRLHHPLDADRAGHADPRQVVMTQVDEHHVLGLVLLAKRGVARVPRREESSRRWG